MISVHPGPGRYPPRLPNIIFEGAEAAVARINLDRAPASEVLDRCRAENRNILEISIIEIS
jgi:D-3-phosphoglycerate dehydrogenase